MRTTIATSVAISVALVGCATSSKDLSASYVSPLTYQAYECDQLAAETRRVQTRVVELGGRLDQAASNDKALTAAAIIVAWPIAFALGGTKQQEAEYSRLKGEYDAVQQAAIAKRCPGIVTALSTGTPFPQIGAVSDVDAVPGLSDSGKAAYRSFLAKPLPRAFVIADGGHVYYTWTLRPKEPSDPADPAARAMVNCQRQQWTNCKVYAVDERVVLIP